MGQPCMQGSTYNGQLFTCFIGPSQTEPALMLVNHGHTNACVRVISGFEREQIAQRSDAC